MAGGVVQILESVTWATRRRISNERGRTGASARRTQNRTLLVLDASLLSDVVGNAQEDGDIVFGRELARVESPDDGKTPTLMDIEGSAGKLSLDCRQWEIVACHSIGAEPAFWSLSAAQSSAKDKRRRDAVAPTLERLQGLLNLGNAVFVEINDRRVDILGCPSHGVALDDAKLVLHLVSLWLRPVLPKEVLRVGRVSDWCWEELLTLVAFESGGTQHLVEQQETCCPSRWV